MRCVRALVCVSLATAVHACSGADATPPLLIHPAGATAVVPDDADDPAIWVNPADHARSLILGTNKVAAPDGALYVFGVDGSVKQVVKPLDRPNNVDIEYGLATPSGPVDIAVVTERLQHRLRVYRITDTGLAPLDAGGIPVLAGQIDEAAMPMGIALYRRPRDGAIFAIVAPKTGGKDGYLWQYRLSFDADAGAVRATFVRRFGTFSGSGEIESVAVDDALGYAYYSDEEFAIRKWAADPDDRNATYELATFGKGAFTLQREGIAIVSKADGTGFIVCTDQIPGGSVLRVYRREGQPGQPHVHDPAVATLVTTADTTDGIDATVSTLGDRFPEGLLVMMNSVGRNYQFYDLRAMLHELKDR